MKRTDAQTPEEKLAYDLERTRRRHDRKLARERGELPPRPSDLSDATGRAVTTQEARKILNSGASFLGSTAEDRADLFVNAVQLALQAAQERMQLAHDRFRAEVDSGLPPSEGTLREMNMAQAAVMRIAGKIDQAHTEARRLKAVEAGQPLTGGVAIQVNFVASRDDVSKPN